MGELGSMWYNIGARTADLQKGLADSKSKLGQFATGFEKVTGVSLKSAGAIALAGKFVNDITQYLKNALAANDAYVTSMTEGAKITGMSTEEYSRYAQVADDLFITQEKLNAIMSAAARQGIDVSLPGILKLSAAYKALNTVEEKNAFTASTFGRQGLQMYKILELEEGALIKKMGAVSQSLVVDKKAQQTAYEYKWALDALNDSLEGIKYSVAQGTMPALTAFNIELADFIESVNESDAITKVFSGTLDFAAQALRFWDGVLTGDISKWWEDKEAVKSFTKELGDVPKAIDAVAIAGADMISMMASLTDIEEEYTSNVEENNAELLTLMEERARLRKAGYSEESAQIKKIDAALDTNAAKAGDNAAAHELATNRIILSYAQQLLAADGLTQEEALFLIQRGVDMGIYADDAVVEMKRVLTEAGKLTAALNGIPSNINININTGLSTGSGGTDAATNYSYGGDDDGPGGANGLNFMVPPGYPNDSFPIRVQSGEHVQVTPANQVQQPQGIEIDYDRMASAFIQALETSPLVR